MVWNPKAMKMWDKPGPWPDSECVYCHGPSERLIMGGVGDDRDGAQCSAIFGYYVCDVCRQVNWENGEPFRILGEHLMRAAES